METLGGRLCTKDGYRSSREDMGLQWTNQAEAYWTKVEVDRQCSGCAWNSEGVPDCMRELQIQLGSIFVAKLFVSNVSEIGWPFFYNWAKRMLVRYHLATGSKTSVFKDSNEEYVHRHSAQADQQMKKLRYGAFFTALPSSSMLTH